MGVIAEGILRGCQGLFTPVSLGYPLSVFNKNSTLTNLVQLVRRHYFSKLDVDLAEFAYEIVRSHQISVSRIVCLFVSFFPVPIRLGDGREQLVLEQFYHENNRIALLRTLFHDELDNSSFVF